MEQTSDAKLIVDKMGQIIFADRGFLNLMGYTEVGRIIGEPLHDVLGIEFQIIEQLLVDLRNTGKVENQFLQLQNLAGRVLETMISVRGTYDDDKLIDADIEFKAIAQENPDSLPTMPDSSHSTSDPQLVEYVLTQIDTIRNVIIQIGGRRSSDTLDQIIQEIGQRNHWQVTINAGEINLAFEHLDKALQIEMLRMILARAVNYAIMLAGYRIVTKRVQAIHDQLNADTRRRVNDTGVSKILNDLLPFNL